MKRYMHSRLLASRGFSLLLATLLLPCLARAQGGLQVDLRSNLSVGAPIRVIQFSPDQKSIAVSVEKKASINIVDPVHASVLRTIESSANEAPCLAFSPDSRLLASCGKKIELWDVETGKLKSEIVNGGEKLLDAITFSPDGHSLAAWTGTMEFTSKGSTSMSFHFSGQIRFWDVETLNIVRSLAPFNHTVWSLAFSPDGSTLGSTGMSVGWKLWDARTGQLRKEKFDGEVHEIAFLGNGNQFAVDSRDKIKIFDTSSGKEIRVLKHRSEISAVACTRDGTLLVSAGRDRKVKFWDLPSGKLLHTLDVSDEISDVVLSDDGKLLITGGSDLKFWSVVRSNN